MGLSGPIIFIFFLSILFLAASYEWLMMSKKNNLLKFLGITFLIFSFYTAFKLNQNYKALQDKQTMLFFQCSQGQLKLAF